MGETVEQITLLKQTESVHLDQGRLEQLYSQLGEAGAEDIVCRALEEVAVRLSHTERCFRQNQLQDMRKSARSLIAIAEQIGMSKLAGVARDVMLSIDLHDKVAMAATLSRLLRIGETSLHEIWDVADYSV